MKQFIHNNKFFLITALILTIIMCFFINQKQGFHEDEIFSYGSSNYKYGNMYQNYGYAHANEDLLYKHILTGSPVEKIKKLIDFKIHPENYENQKDEILKKEIPIFRTKQDALNYAGIQKEDIFSLFSVYYNQAIDVHPPLFYFLVHFISIFFFNQFSKYIIFLLNLIFFIGTLWIIYKIMHLLNKKKFAISTVILYGASIGAISTVMFQRMYMMLTFFSILYLYYTIKWIKQKYILKKKDSILWIITIICGFLTQYYFCIYIVLLFIILSFYLLYKKKYKNWLTYFKLHLLSAAIGILLFPSSIYHIFFSYRGFGNTENNSLPFFHMINYYLQQIFKLFSINFIFIIIVTLLLIGLLIYRKIHKKEKKEENKILYLSILILPIVLFIIIVSKIAPYLGADYTSRYIMLLFPMIAICFVYGLACLINKKKLVQITFIFSILLSFYGLLSNTPVYLYKDYKQSMTIAKEYQNDYFIYIYDNYFTHLSSMPEFLTYTKSLIINANIYDFEHLKTMDELQNQKEFILCIKNWMNTDELLEKVLDYSGFTQSELLADIKGDVGSTYYRIKK